MITTFINTLFSITIFFRGHKDNPFDTIAGRILQLYFQTDNNRGAYTFVGIAKVVSLSVRNQI